MYFKINNFFTIAWLRINAFDQPLKEFRSEERSLRKLPPKLRPDLTELRDGLSGAVKRALLRLVLFSLFSMLSEEATTLTFGGSLSLYLPLGGAGPPRLSLDRVDEVRLEGYTRSDCIG